MCLCVWCGVVYSVCVMWCMVYVVVYGCMFVWCGLVYGVCVVYSVCV